jgi:type IV secretory pathway protease TraF
MCSERWPVVTAETGAELPSHGTDEAGGRGYLPNAIRLIREVKIACAIDGDPIRRRNSCVNGRATIPGIGIRASSSDCRDDAGCHRYFPDAIVAIVREIDVPGGI